VAIVVAALMVLVETLYFASLQPGCSHVSSTISELGQTGAPHANQVSLGFFLPVGLLVWFALWLVYREASDRYVSLALIALSSLGAGYVAAALFPCDPGAPLFGIWRTQIHNLAGFVDYGGTGIGFLLVGRHFAGRGVSFRTGAFLAGGVLVLLGLALLSVEATFRVRGVIQRVTEVIQFTGLFCAVVHRGN
jgi:hypothetical protein